MPKLLRPNIPLEVRCRVAMRQLGWGRLDAAQAMTTARGTYGAFLAELLMALKLRLGAEKLHLDHDPALENRMRRSVQVYSRGRNRFVTEFSPPANDPDHLVYREGGFRGSAHDIKTRVRGERGQFADNVIAKRARRRAKKIAQKNAPRSKKSRSPAPWPKGRKLQSRKFQQRNIV